MTKQNSIVFASSKISGHQERIEAYLRGERIYPITVELDLTQRCTLNCPQCPYSSSKKAGLTLDMKFLDRFFSICGPNIPGLVLSGGEPTCVPHFPETVSLAREKGMREIVVISNGTRIHVPEVQESLLENVNALRISMYHWHESDSPQFMEMLKRIKELKNTAIKSGSKLEIGAAMLTRSEWNHRYKPVSIKVLEAGVDWLYFHPFCINWDSNYPIQANQKDVIKTLNELRSDTNIDQDKIQIPYERYYTQPLEFSKLHGSHFLIQVGADGINYAGPECKYNPSYALIDLNENLDDDFLWKPERLNKIAAINSNNYSFIGTKHRPPMFSDYIEKIIQHRSGKHMNGVKIDTKSFMYPDII